MKKLLIIYSFTMASTLLLGGCGKTTQMVNDAKQGKGLPLMTRLKTPSGLEYEIIEEGTGASPQRGQMVTVHYTGWLDENGEKGTQFDSSVKRGQPFSFIIGVGQVIRGWDEGVMGMKIGEKRRLIIPSQLGYGAHGAGGLIPPHAKLIFDVELLKVG